MVRSKSTSSSSRRTLSLSRKQFYVSADSSFSLPLSRLLLSASLSFHNLPWAFGCFSPLLASVVVAGSGHLLRMKEDRQRRQPYWAKLLPTCPASTEPDEEGVLYTRTCFSLVGGRSCLALKHVTRTRLDATAGNSWDRWREKRWMGLGRGRERRK